MADSKGKKMLKDRKKVLKQEIQDLESAKEIQLNEAISLQTKIDALKAEKASIKADIDKL